MAEDTQEMLEEQKLRRMAQASSFYRTAVEEMVKAGYDPDELDDAVEAAEIELAKENREKQKAMRHRRAVRSF